MTSWKQIKKEVDEAYKECVKRYKKEGTYRPAIFDQEVSKDILDTSIFPWADHFDDDTRENQ